MTYFLKNQQITCSDNIEDEEQTLNIETLNNNIYFYEDINKQSALKLRIEIQKLINKHKIISASNECDFIPNYILIVTVVKFVHLHC